ncbi:hypothetical protein CMO96_04090 [Candidatus Woesebacteria bacterium]|nr:hypothetical protein [Candidatus Woesebacteria bacterium]|tara:strand:+ start:408 stop:947 length:540 start_codon:yes stop_codon:yes gene_type:complete
MIQKARSQVSDFRFQLSDNQRSEHLTSDIRHPTIRKFGTGFTLVELLVVLAIISIVISVSFVAFQGAQASGRDTKRKADLEDIRSALEIYRSDCGSYPATLTFGSSLQDTCVGGGTSTYMDSVPNDPLYPRETAEYGYELDSSNTSKYKLCAKLERGSGSSACAGGCGTESCNYTVTNP